MDRSRVPDDAGIGVGGGRYRRFAAVVWMGLLAAALLTGLVLTGVLGNNPDAESGPPEVVVEFDGEQPDAAAVTAGDYAVGVVFTDGHAVFLFGTHEVAVPGGG